MSGILYLGADDFTIRKGEKGNLLCLNYDVQGLSLVLFYSNECQHSTKLMVKYKQLPFNINGCQFTMINVNRPDNRRVVQMAGQTIVPITYVPDIILYVDGIPYMRYDGQHEIHAIKTFVLDIYQQLQKMAFMDVAKPPTSHQRMMPPQHPSANQQGGAGMSNGGGGARDMRVGGGGANAAVQQQQGHGITQQRNAIPAYTIGRPKCSGERDDVCYLSFKQAYDDGPAPVQTRAMPNPYA